MPQARSQGTGRGGGPQTPPWRTCGLLYHFSQGVGAIPDVGLLEVYLPKLAGMMGGRSQSCPLWRQRAGEKKGETATAAEDDPSWEAFGQGLQGGHGSRSQVVCSSRLQLQHSALMRESSVSIRESRQGKGREARRCEPYLCCDSWCALQEVRCTLYRDTNISLSFFFQVLVVN